ACITTAAQHSNFELNVMMPVMAHNILESIEILATSSRNFLVKCISGIEADREVCAHYAESSLATCTSLAPVIGYDQAAALAKKAYKENKTVRQTAMEMKVLPEEQLKDVLDLMKMTKPGM
ncbi:MAG: hypothetical protein KDD53_12840, partial [Bdellovibrionales bacterium]|nr:hypothetical protein [Bdellovibrionales bacterium]